MVSGLWSYSLLLSTHFRLERKIVFAVNLDFNLSSRQGTIDTVTVFFFFLILIQTYQAARPERKQQREESSCIKRKSPSTVSTASMLDQEASGSDEEGSACNFFV